MGAKKQGVESCGRQTMECVIMGTEKQSAESRNQFDK